MVQQEASFIRRVLNVLFSSRRLAVRVEALEQELDEYRRDSLRVAEMLDLIEHRLTPGADPQRESESN